MKTTNQVSLLMRLPPQTVSAVTNTAAFKLDRARSAAVFLIAGDIGAGATVAFKLQSSADNTTFTDLPGKAISPFNDADDNKEAAINVDGEELPDGHQYVRAVVTPTGGNATVAVVAIGADNRYEPPSHVSTLAQVV